MTHKIKHLLKLFLLFSISFDTHAVLDINITQGIEQPLPIAIVPFGWSQTDRVPPVDLATIIGNDLGRSGRFEVMDEQYIPQRPVDFETVNFSDWRRLGIENILIGNLELTDSGDYDISFRLIDIYRKNQIARLRISAKKNMLRRVAHQISDIVFEKLTGIPGAFDTRIAYITVKQDNNDTKLYTLTVADMDGHNAQILLASEDPLLSPVWSPDGKEIAYVSFEGKRSTIFIQDISSGKREKVAAFPGTNSAPSWSPDGTRLAMTLSKDGNAEIYVMDMDTRLLKRITHHDGIDTEPAWSPDSQKLAFTSDRTGRPQIYETDASGGPPRRISLNGDYNAALAILRKEKPSLWYMAPGVFIALVCLIYRTVSSRH